MISCQTMLRPHRLGITTTYLKIFFNKIFHFLLNFEFKQNLKSFSLLTVKLSKVECLPNRIKNEFAVRRTVLRLFLWKNNRKVRSDKIELVGLCSFWFDSIRNPLLLRWFHCIIHANIFNLYL